ncbi:TVP38/TMEM64 family protein [Thioalkalivibrio nitratireducens]|uniref:TVP38/TMEM64 family protein n=1 Tax=Thioalkalivibrio nitratireducens TaxID=186931 RepID=UPI0009F9D672|nr:VTT domain-containing protein [Thioalkalivibrio nitratireducens]
MPSSKTLRPPRSDNGGIAVRPSGGQPHAPASRVRWWWLAVVGLALLAGAGAVAQFGPWLLGWTADSQAALRLWVEVWPLAAAVTYVLVVTVGKVTPFPGGFLLMFSGGFLFGPGLGSVLSALGSAFSAVMIAALGRRLFQEPIHRRWGARLASVTPGVTANGFHFILAARLFPLVPAWAVNIVPVIFPIPLNRVLLATFLGLLPLSFVVATLGHQVSSIAAAGEFALSDVLTPQLLLALATLAALALLAPLLRARRARS